ncbi:ParA family protein [Actinomyces succiniciruminis]|uniref:Cobyrinic acid ac-diamide synthase n=1 Tax=Actinomyces succiniciruminis TaxID=1522002 RepID=A0A1L7RQ48_9ACTO|nr:ParA family protein [Actinomyces succiniciruminis]CED91273.1 cobyrinic acid ac-diamide synthase [Actinomyces succiniciruminis]
MTIYVIATPKGGVGKTTTAAEIAAALARAGRKVLALDLDQQGNLTGRLGVTSATEVAGTMADILTGDIELTEAAVPAPAVDAVDVAVGGHALADVEAAPPGDLITFLRDELRTDAVAGRWDDVVIDTPPSVAALSLAGLAAADAIIATVTPAVEAFDQLKRLQALIDARLTRRINRSARIDWIVPVMFGAGAAVGRGRLLDREVLQQLKATYGDRVTAPVREAVVVRDAYMDGQPVSVYDPTAPVTADYHHALQAILETEVAA